MLIAKQLLHLKNGRVQQQLNSFSKTKTKLTLNPNKIENRINFSSKGDKKQFELDDLLNNIKSQKKEKEEFTPSLFGKMPKETDQGEGIDQGEEQLESMIRLLKFDNKAERGEGGEEGEEEAEGQTESHHGTIYFDEDSGKKLEGDKYFEGVPREKAKAPKVTLLKKEDYLNAVKEETKMAKEFREDLQYKSLKELRFFDMYPHTVKNWIEDVKTPFGFYDDFGYWNALEETHQITTSEDFPWEKDEDPNDFWKEVPQEFRGHFRFGVTEQDLVHAPKKVKLALTYKDAPNHQIKKLRIRQAMKPFMKDEYDSGQCVAQGKPSSFDKFDY
eukprot:TRINITY_DN2143_c0_g1_i2.p1 TRINITY_DN2143_c0_g1~~TRINITY_DN2143_c0_g1_i2.p1  ORF type:complete len:330 (+),score=115.04 TRINITY_DN2143_c0_g1_i2:57-1046(+)